MMTDRSTVMYHDAAGGFQGYLTHMKSRLNWIDRLVSKFDAYIANRAGITFNEFMGLMPLELWLDADDATTRKFNDVIVSLNVSSLIGTDTTSSKSRAESRQKLIEDVVIIHK